MLTIVMLLGLFVLMNEPKMILPLRGKITSSFGFRFNGFHNGIDISAPIGSPIYCPLNGIVSMVFVNNLGGIQLVIKHQDYSTGYAHLSKLKVKKGQRVNQGQIIALSGNTGKTTGPHLHFVIRKNGQLINPESVLKF